MAITTSTFLPTASIQRLTFVKFNDTVTLFGTAIAAAFPGATVQVNADTASGHTSYALVIIGEGTTYPVAPNQWFGQNAAGQWQVFDDTKMQGGVASQYTPLPYS